MQETHFSFYEEFVVACAYMQNVKFEYILSTQRVITTHNTTH
jgi:hypothetical protein